MKGVKNTTGEDPIDKLFSESSLPEIFMCDDCRHMKLHRQTRKLFTQREDFYVSVLEKIAQMANPNGGMCGRLYDTLPGMLEAFFDKSGDKAKLKIEVNRLQKENEQLALEVIRLRS